MSERRIELLKDERIVFDRGPAVLTNQRLLAEAAGVDEPVEAFLKDLATFKKVTGGQESRLRPGLWAIAAGAAIVAIGIIARGSSELLETLLFLVGALSFLVGCYLSLSSALRVRPHTMVLFQTQDLKDIAVAFPGWDNPDADELTRTFVRAKRAI